MSYWLYYSCYVTLSYCMLCYVALYHAMIHYMILSCNIILYYIILYYIILYYIIILLRLTDATIEPVILFNKNHMKLKSYLYMNSIIQHLLYNENLFFDEHPWFVDWLGFDFLKNELLIWYIARGNHLSNTSCLMHIFFKHDESCSNS